MKKQIFTLLSLCVLLLFSTGSFAQQMVATPKNTPAPQFKTPEEKEQWIKDHPDEYQKMQNQNMPGNNQTAPANNARFDQADAFVYAQYMIVQPVKVGEKSDDILHSKPTLSLDFGDLTKLKMPLPPAIVDQTSNMSKMLATYGSEIDGLNFLHFSGCTEVEKNVVQFNDAIVTIYLMKLDFTKIM